MKSTNTKSRITKTSEESQEEFVGSIMLRFSNVCIKKININFGEGLTKKQKESLGYLFSYGITVSDKFDKNIIEKIHFRLKNKRGLKFIIPGKRNHVANFINSGPHSLEAYIHTQKIDNIRFNI